jgi:hypothetical protein
VQPEKGSKSVGTEAAFLENKIAWQSSNSNLNPAKLLQDFGKASRDFNKVIRTGFSSPGIDGILAKSSVFSA